MAVAYDFQCFGILLDGLIRPEYSWFQAVQQFGSIWSLWFLVTPVIFWAARRFPVDGGRWVKALGVHVAPSVLWAGPYFMVTLIVQRLLAIQQTRFRDRLRVEIGMGPNSQTQAKRAGTDVGSFEHPRPH